MKYANSIAIIITFYPNDDFYVNLIKISRQTSYIIIYDNTDIYDQRINDKSLPENCTIMNSLANVGIGQALNEAIQYIQMNYICNFIFTFDQDTTIEDTFVQNMIKDYQTLLNHELVIMTSPMIHDVNTKKTIELKNYSIDSAETNYQKILLCITSGSMIINNVYQKSKIIFREEFFIDHVDHDFCLKANNLGYEIIQMKNIYIYHALGVKLVKKFFFKEFTVQEHSPLRLYYFTRNGFVLCKEHLTNLLFVKYFIKIFFNKLIKIVLLEPNKTTKLKFIFKGFMDKKLGKLDD